MERSWSGLGALLEGPQDGAQEAPRRLPGGTSGAKMEPQRPSNEPQEVSGVRESPGKQLGAPRRNGKRPASARSARARAPRERSLQHRGVIGEPPQRPESSLHNRQATAGTGTQLAPPPSHRRDRKTACTTAKPPASIGQQLHERLQAQLFLTPLSVFSLGRFGARGGPKSTRK